MIYSAMSETTLTLRLTLRQTGGFDRYLSTMVLRGASVTKKWGIIRHITIILSRLRDITSNVF